MEVKGYRGEDAKDKKATMDTYWVPGVNNLGTYGRWAFADKFVATMLYGAISGIGEKAPSELEELLDISKDRFPKTHSSIKEVYSLIDEDEFDE